MNDTKEEVMQCFLTMYLSKDYGLEFLDEYAKDILAWLNDPDKDW